MLNEKLHILLIDDDPSEADLFRNALEKLGLDFTLYYSKDALDQVYTFLEGTKIHMIFLDIRMPEKNGIKFLKEIKQRIHDRHIPIIMYTVSTDQSEIDECFALGAHGYLVKPYAEQNFLSALRHIFELDWRKPQPQSSVEEFVVNYAFV